MFTLLFTVVHLDVILVFHCLACVWVTVVLVSVKVAALSWCKLIVPIGSWLALLAYLCPGWLVHPVQRVEGTQGLWLGI